ncbi:hypothetical protein [Cognatilysobacter terrigena]|uniref:hypothetical protein n=1 Tax=Cognatilysobacter terrigena TaxID=2488749 RepID=UPI001061B405|nr:hypothetical protein [Lysobacter terrigena]
MAEDDTQDRIEALEADVAFLKEQMSLLAQYLAIMIGRAQVNDCMLSALILSHPDREALNAVWRQSSAAVIPNVVVRGPSPWDSEIADTAKQRVDHLNELADPRGS